MVDNPFLKSGAHDSHGFATGRVAEHKRILGGSRQCDRLIASQPLAAAMLKAHQFFTCDFIVIRIIGL
jgi:hypothetical protein